MKNKFKKLTVQLDKECIDFINQVAKESGNSFQASFRFLIWLGLRDQAAVAQLAEQSPCKR